MNERPPVTAFPHDTMSGDGCREVSGALVCHLLEGHDGPHWDDVEQSYWAEPD